MQYMPAYSMSSYIRGLNQAMTLFPIADSQRKRYEAMCCAIVNHQARDLLTGEDKSAGEEWNTNDYY